MRITISKLILYGATFLILYASTSFFCKNQLSESINILICICSVVVLMLVTRNIYINKQMFIIFLFLSILGLISSSLAGDEIKLIIYSILSMFVALLYVSIVPLHKFKTVFINIMVFLSVIAIMLYALYLVFPEIISLMPTITNKSGRTVYNMFFAVISPGEFLRAESIFWEPGAYQTFINFTIPLLIFSEESRQKVKLVILYIALILTFSTTGYIVGYLYLILLLWKYNIAKVSKRLKIVLIIMSMVAFAILIIYFMPEQIHGMSFGVEKVQEFLSGPSTDFYNSASVRFDAIYYPGGLFLEHPILGAGYSGLDGLSNVMLHGMVTCTPVNYFAMYGIIYGCITMVCFYKFSFSISKASFCTVIIFIGYLLAMISEQYVAYPIINIFLMYGAQKIIKYEANSMSVELGE